MRRLALIALLCLPGVALGATDSFPSTGALSANWTSISGGDFTGTLTVTSANNVAPAQWTTGAAIYTGTSFAGDQSSQVTIQVAPGGGNNGGVCVRLSAAGNGYCFDGSAGQISKYTAKVGAFLVGGCGNPVNGTLVKLSVTGTTITAYRDAGQVCQVTDASYSSGYPGMMVSDGNAASPIVAVGSFVATGDVSAASTPTASPLTATLIGSGTVSVSLSCASPSPTIRYTTDGSAATGSSSVYSSALTITPPQTVQAICQSSGLTDSAMMTAPYWLSGGWTGTHALTRPH
jgi:hypothetical protein